MFDVGLEIKREMVTGLPVLQRVLPKP